MRQDNRVLHVLGCMDIGGAETLVMNVYRALDRKQLQFDFLTHSFKEGAYESEIRSLGGRVFHIQAPVTAGLIRYCRAFNEVLRGAGPFAAVHSHVQKFSGYVAFLAARAGVPVRVVHSHTALDVRNDHGVRRIYSRLMRVLALRYGTSLLGCSEEACQLLYGVGARQDSRVGIIHNAIDSALFASGCARREEVRRELHLSPSDTVFCHVGNFAVPKNHAFLLGVFREIAQRVPNSQLLLAGEGALMTDVVSLVSRFGLKDRVNFLGLRRDIPALLAAADAFIFPSLWEGIPTALIEAQMAGLPCLASSRINRDVDLGIGLVSFLDLEAGAKGWAEAASRLCSQTGKVSTVKRVKAAKKAGYEIAEVVKQLVEIYCAQ